MGQLPDFSPPGPGASDEVWFDYFDAVGSSGATWSQVFDILDGHDAFMRYLRSPRGFRSTHQYRRRPGEVELGPANRTWLLTQSMELMRRAHDPVLRRKDITVVLETEDRDELLHLAAVAESRGLTVAAHVTNLVRADLADDDTQAALATVDDAPGPADETTHLLASPANAARLRESLRHAMAGPIDFPDGTWWIEEGSPAAISLTVRFGPEEKDELTALHVRADRVGVNPIEYIKRLIRDDIAGG